MRKLGNLNYHIFPSPEVAATRWAASGCIATLTWRKATPLTPRFSETLTRRSVWERMLSKMGSSEAS